MTEIKFSEKKTAAAPSLTVLQIEADVINRPTSDSLWSEITAFGHTVAETIEMSQVNKRPAIAATRQAYKKCGKDPNRYRPSAESMMRRLVKGMDLYRIDSLVDLVNLLSLMSGYSIGGFDRDKIDGDTLTLGIGEADEPFEGIGRGPLNIEGLPVYRDNTGGIGTPTSDNERTKMDLSTRHILLLVNIYGSEMSIDDTTALARRLLTEYADATNITTRIIRP